MVGACRSIALLIRLDFCYIDTTLLAVDPSDIMWLVNVSEVMTTELICLPKTCTIVEVGAIVEKFDTGKLTLNAFPVVASVFNPRLRTMVS
eukprot:SAG31_NODE_36147_length_316_cov_0.705069_1_plen_90_part_01